MIVPEIPKDSKHPEIRVRGAEAADEPALAALDRATWSTLHAVLPASGPGQPFFDERHLPAHYLVADAGAEGAVGYLRLVPPTPMACHTHVRQIQGLAVAEAARGRGVARTLLRAALDRARAEGATRITLRVLGHNAPARALYESEGFTVEGVLPGEFLLAGAYVDDVLMGRSLLG
ncbi:GNAT family N-acetyltransferase [Streptomyces sp. NPDC048623]|uniref:GNAT family N-acetyltransferase n=1 Tax=Streptomyces sp. NPDC048623 TaxID=3155761 RepID=UPI0034271D64